MGREYWLSIEGFCSLKEKVFQLLGCTMEGGSRVIGFSYSRRSKLTCELHTGLLLLLLICLFCAFFPIRIQINTVIKTEQFKQKCDCRQDLSHGDHYITSTLHLYIMDR